jgi:RNA polymerase sigma factor (sigma-70 family)
MEETDDTLWARCQSGSADAMAELYRRHVRAIYSFAFHATGDWSRAEDVSSIVFTQAWRHRTRSIDPGMVRAWLHGVAANVLRNEQRSSRRWLALAHRAQAAQPAGDFMDEEALAARLDDQGRARALLAVIRDFPEGERMAIAMVWWGGLTYEEAAAALEVPVGTVRSRLARARERLRTPAGRRAVEAVAGATSTTREGDGHEDR